MVTHKPLIVSYSKSSVKSGTTHIPHLQVAAMCWRRTRKGKLRFLLITSRDTGRWVIPKGWPMKNRTQSEAAHREAWEEAGVRGEVSTKSVGVYTYRKLLRKNKSIQCVVKVFPLHVSALVREYPEYGQRKNKWFSTKQAALNVREPELAELFRKVARGAD